MKIDELKQAFLEAMAEAIMIPDDTIPAYMREGKSKEIILRNGQYVETYVTPANIAIAKKQKHLASQFDHSAEKERRIAEYAECISAGMPISFREPIPDRPKLKRELFK